MHRQVYTPHPEQARLNIAKNGRHAASPLAGVKVTSWLNNVWHLAEAQAQGWNEVVLLNERGEVARCTTANIFCVGRRQGCPRRPFPPVAWKRVTRGMLLEIAALNSVSLTFEQTLTPEDLYAARRSVHYIHEPQPAGNQRNRGAQIYGSDGTCRSETGAGLRRRHARLHRTTDCRRSRVIRSKAIPRASRIQTPARSSNGNLNFQAA